MEHYQDVEGMRQLGGDGANTSLAVTAFGGDMIKAVTNCGYLTYFTLRQQQH